MTIQKVSRVMGKQMWGIVEWCNISLIGQDLSQGGGTICTSLKWSCVEDFMDGIEYEIRMMGGG